MDPAQPQPAQPEHEPVSADVHRAASRMFASGVTVAAAQYEGRVHAIAATAFCSLSLEPPLVLLAVNRTGQLVDFARRSQHLGISILSEDQREISEWAASTGRVPGPAVPFTTRVARTGAPLIEGAVAWFDCEVQSAVNQGDHIVIVGLVVEAWAAPQARPLLYFDRTYHALGEALGEGDAPQLNR
ncbi:MAG TPA: flavin reductase family protein [Candidatus Dormibacteraeota bacterium]|nr:flavin reductase family protein [Candidatus Dormibacteraeota bacterium]